jgi:enoyl-CoA hydratase/carnithine racemase
VAVGGDAAAPVERRASVRAHVRLARTGAIARLVIDRPEKRNALSLQVATELCAAVARAEADPETRVIVLTGAGDRAFASGADLDELPDAIATPEKATEYDARIAALYDALEGSRLPVIARIQAPAIGGGCLLAAACDVRVASESATFALPAARIGLMLSAREHALAVESLGPSRAKLLLFSGRRLTAREAAEWGLVDLVAPPERLDERVDELAQEIAACAPLAVAAAKRMVRAAVRGGEAGAVAEACYQAVYGSEDLREGLAAVKARRKPGFKGR